MIGLRRIVLLLALASVTAGFALHPRRAESPSDLSAVFEKLDVMIPMRDGVRLHAEIYVPRNSPQPAPFIFERTPYGVTDDESGITTKFGIYREMVPGGYIFVFQDIRGRFKSEGQFLMLRRPRDPRDPHAIDEGTDTYDTIDWLLKNVPHNNGRVGLLGISYGGWLTVMAMLEPHPALKAVSEQASPDDMFLGDDFHHNGAFRLSYGFEYAAMMEAGKTISPFHFDRDDTFEWYLALGPLANANARYLHGNMPTWNDFATHPNYDEYWRREAVRPYLKTITVPDLNVAGWWDQEDFFGPQKIYEALEKHDTPALGLFRGRTLEPWRMGGRAGKLAGPDSLWQRHGQVFSREDPGGVVCLLAKGPGETALRESHDLRDGHQSMEDLCRVATAPGDSAAQAVFSGERRALVRSARPRHRRRIRQLCFRPRASGTLPPAADPAHRRRRWWLDDVAGGRSEIRPETARCGDVANRSA